MKFNHQKINNLLNVEEEDNDFDNIINPFVPEEDNDDNIKELENIIDQSIVPITNTKGIDIVKNQQDENFPVILQQNSSDAITAIFHDDCSAYEQSHIEVTKNFNDILSSSKKLLDMAVYILNATANGSDSENDADLITSTANLVNSIKDIIKESNQSVLHQQDFIGKAKLEHLKAKLKKEIALTTKRPVSLGDGNIININGQPQEVMFNPTKMLRELMIAEKEINSQI